MTVQYAFRGWIMGTKVRSWSEINKANRVKVSLTVQWTKRHGLRWDCCHQILP